MPGGRPSMLSPKLADTLVQLRTKSLLFDAQIALKAGVHPETLRNWLSWGLRQNAKEPYKKFAKRYARAKTKVEEAQLKKGAEGGKEGAGNRWWLEKAFPKRYGLSVPASGPPQAIEIEDLLREGDEQNENLVELMRNPPPELQAAMKIASADIRAFLDREVPLLTVAKTP